ncbi:MAG: UPF0147 family protein [Candidatus Hodarchaeota archaeon]
MMSDDIEQKLEQSKALLDMIARDQAVPKNIRRAAKDARMQLEVKKGTAGMKCANAISILDEASQDPNSPMHARTKMWQVVSILETVKD